MPIHELNEEQIRTWTLEEKDRWWLTTVFRGDMPQLTFRAAITGMMLGGLLSLTNLYIGAKTGWTLGVGITSVILAYGLFKVMSRTGIVTEFTVLENNAMQSIATAAGYMTSPMISSLAAYMMVTNTVIPMWQTAAWIVILAFLGVLFAFPFKRRFINDEQQPFPEGRAAGIVMDSLHHGDAAASLLKAKLLAFCAAGAAIVKLLQTESIMALAKLKALPEFLDEWIYEHVPTPEIMGTKVTALTLRPELDLAMIGAGGLMGIRTAGSLCLGALINYAVLAPIMIERGDILPGPKGVGFREITFWSLWAGVAMVTSASLVSFFAKPQMLISSFAKLFKRSTGSTDVLGHIELPLAVSLVGIPILGVIVMIMANAFFGVAFWLGAVALALVFVFCLIAINSTGLTSITPIGAMGKLTQLTFGGLAPGDIKTNLMTAGITGEVASHSANLLSDIKPGYMLGAKPRQQAIGHALGAVAGALLAVPVFYLVFLKLPADQAFSLAPPNVEKVTFESKYPMPSATVWKAVADILTQGLENIKPSAQIGALIGLVLGVIMELWRMLSKNRFPISPVALGLGFIIHFFTCFSMFLGALFFWLIEKGSPKESALHRVGLENQEPICAGLIAGGALMGIAVQVVEVFFLS